jgi:hypothetical protein
LNLVEIQAFPVDDKRRDFPSTTLMAFLDLGHCLLQVAEGIAWGENICSHHRFVSAG